MIVDGNSSCSQLLVKDPDDAWQTARMFMQHGHWSRNVQAQLRAAMA